MRNRDERLKGQDKHWAKDDPLHDKGGLSEREISARLSP
jgi:hypothetical protein